MYFPGCCGYDGDGLNRILPAALQTGECQRIVSEIKAESRKTTPPQTRSRACLKNAFHEMYFTVCTLKGMI